MSRRSNIKKERELNDPLLEKLKNTVFPDDIKSLTGILEGKFPPNTTYDEMRYEYFKERYNL